MDMKMFDNYEVVPAVTVDYERCQKLKDVILAACNDLGFMDISCEVSGSEKEQEIPRVHIALSLYQCEPKAPN